MEKTVGNEKCLCWDVPGLQAACESRGLSEWVHCEANWGCEMASGFVKLLIGVI